MAKRKWIRVQEEKAKSENKTVHFECSFSREVVSERIDLLGAFEP